MNAINIISARVSPQSSPAPSRSNSLGAISLAVTPAQEDEEEEEDKNKRKKQQERSKEENGGASFSEKDAFTAEPDEYHQPLQKSQDLDRALGADPDATLGSAIDDENTPLLSAHGGEPGKDTGLRSSAWHVVPRRIASTFLDSIRWVLSTLAAPGVYLIACLYDETGHFAPLLQLKKLFGRPSSRKLAAAYEDGALMEKRRQHGRTAAGGRSEEDEGTGSRSSPSRRDSPAAGSSSSGMSSEEETEFERRGESGSSRHGRSKSLQNTEEIAPARRSVRIKLHDDSHRQRRHRKAQSSVGGRKSSAGDADSKDILAQMKSPTSPVGALTKYPRTPAPPRPLIPRRQPSYINLEAADRSNMKTLVLDLDETLIHSMSKGGRMSTGHMVEVRLNTAFVGMGGQTNIGPQHPILYYVHKRPHCDDFLRRVCKWYNLVVFTASVQEYADPVIDWLESERKFFSARYYRQHCTFRHGAFIKDLSSVEPDLSKVMILDNSPLSYMFHQDNAIPIQGWINDPTDNDLLNLVPLLEGLQYVSDVRALLALREGEVGQQAAAI